MNVRRLIHRLRLALVALLFLVCWVVSGSAQTIRPHQDQRNLTPQQIRTIVNKIGLIQGLPQKQGEPQWDEYAQTIVALGKRAAPLLVQRITDSTPSKVVEFFPYKIGDLALALLSDIYRPPGWPFPDNSVKIRIKYGDFRDYTTFINSPGARQRLKSSWKKYIKEH